MKINLEMPYFSLICCVKNLATLFFKVLIFGKLHGNQWQVHLTPNATDSTNMCTAFPKQSCVSKLCIHMHDPK